MSAQPLADHDHRQRALDTAASFIVQAPAGSGKTELLTLRFLKLLLTCEQPEQVLAITFTRKAANEMSRRIAEALRWATNCIDNQIEPERALERQRFDIVRQVLARDAQYNWHLLQNPARLRVQTIDRFCFYLANQLPVLSQLGGNPQVSEDATPCFIDAISNTLAQLESDLPVSDDIATLLMHLDNDLGISATSGSATFWKSDTLSPTPASICSRVLSNSSPSLSPQHARACNPTSPDWCPC